MSSKQKNTISNIIILYDKMWKELQLALDIVESEEEYGLNNEACVHSYALAVILCTVQRIGRVVGDTCVRDNLMESAELEASLNKAREKQLELINNMNFQEKASNKGKARVASGLTYIEAKISRVSVMKRAYELLLYMEQAHTNDDLVGVNLGGILDNDITIDTEDYCGTLDMFCSSSEVLVDVMET